MLRYGIISEVDYEKGLARVNFDELRMISGWLTLPDSMRQVKQWPVNCQVAVDMHPNGEDGEILHRVISEDDNAPTWANEHTEGYQFSDGTAVYYDASAKKLHVNGGLNEIIFDCSKLTVNGTIEATGDVKAGAVSLKNHVHPATPALMAGSVAVTGTVTIGSSQ